MQNGSYNYLATWAVKAWFIWDKKGHSLFQRCDQDMDGFGIVSHVIDHLITLPTAPRHDNQCHASTGMNARLTPPVCWLIWSFCNANMWHKISWKEPDLYLCNIITTSSLNKNRNDHLSSPYFQNVICKMAANVSQPQCIHSSIHVVNIMLMLFRILLGWWYCPLKDYIAHSTVLVEVKYTFDFKLTKDIPQH